MMMPYATPAYQQIEQETLEAMDRILFAGQGHRAAVAAHQGSVAVSLQMLADMGRVVAGTAQMAGMANAVRVVQEKAA